jgi:uncharacterized protein YbjT (DUF2867 family)
MPSVLLLGATGLVGSACLRLLLDDPGFPAVVTLTRRALPGDFASPKLDARVAELDRLDLQAGAFTVEQVICALGTTIRAAGSRERFRAVDHELPLAAARLARERGARHFLLVSSVGADPGSRFFYTRVKGELERDLGTLGFRSLSIFRPSLLLGSRREFRLGERMAQLFAWVPLGPWTAIRAEAVAAAIVRVAKQDVAGTRIVESGEMRAWAREAGS